MIENLLYGIIIILIIGIIGSLKACFTQKGKNQALLEDSRRLTEEVEAVKNDFEKKKYKYQQKFNAYKAYFELIDIHHKKANDDVQKRFLPIISSFNTKYLNAAEQNDKGEENAAIIEFSKKVMELTTDLNNELLRIRHETNSLKLLASNEIGILISDLDALHEKMFDISSKIMSSMNSIEFMTYGKIPDSLTEIANGYTDEINSKRNQIRSLMKNELDLE